MQIAIPGFRLLEVVGTGASGTIYRAVQEGLVRTVAVKVLAPGLFGEAETRARFLREAKLQAQLSHPNLLALFDAGFAGGQPYLVTEFLEGGTLRELLASAGCLEVREAVRIAGQVVAGLACAHGAGIVHRDLKPENVLFGAGEDRVAKVADFGLAKALASEQFVETAGGVVLGTPGYLAPEAMVGASAGPASDIYAVGVMLYEMLAGRRPFEGRDFAEIVKQQLRGETAPLPGSVPDGLEQLVIRCLDCEPSRRPSSEELLDRLNRLKVEPALPRGPALATVARRAEKVTPEKIGRNGPAAAANKTAMARAQTPAPVARRWLRVAGACAMAGIALAFLAIGRAPNLPMFRGPKDGRAGVAGTGGAHDPGRPSETGPGTTGASATPLTRPIAIDHVTCAADSAHVWFSSPAGPGSLVTWPGNGDRRRPASVVPLHDGKADCLITGLAPATRYRCGLDRPAGSPDFAFTTLSRLRDSTAAFIATGSCSETTLVARGLSVVCFWVSDRGSASHVHFRESLDGGLTWGSENQLDPVDKVYAVDAVWCESGLQTFWTHHFPYMLSARFRPEGSSRWNETVERPWLVDRTPATEASEGSLVLMGVGGPGASLSKAFRLSPGAGRGVPVLPGPSFPRLDVFRLMRSGDRVVALFTEKKDAGTSRRIGCTSIDASLASTWEPIQYLTPEGIGVHSRGFAMAGAAGKLLTVYELDSNLESRLSTDDGRTFSAPRPPFSEPATSRTPSLASRNREFFLVHQLLGGGRFTIQVNRSLDGARWTPAGSASLPVVFALEVADLATTVNGDRLIVVVNGAHDGLVVMSFPLRP